MLSTISNLTVFRSNNAAQAAVRALNLPRLRGQLSREIQQTKAKLRDADAEFRVM